MFSLNKILVLGAILVGVWYAFRLIGRLDRARKRRARDDARDDGRGGGGGGGGRDHRDHGPGPGPRRDDDGVIDLVPDKDGSYVAKGSKKDRA